MHIVGDPLNDPLNLTIHWCGSHYNLVIYNSAIEKFKSKFGNFQIFEFCVTETQLKNQYKQFGFNTNNLVFGGAHVFWVLDNKNWVI